MEGFIANFGLYLAYILTILGVVMAVVFPLIKSMDDPKKLINSAIGVGILLVVFGLGYLISGSEITARYIESGVESEGLSKMIGGMLTMVYILLGIAAAGIVYTELNKAIK
jgi:nitrogen fixation/metabolism regulation signal transduction histidine kinase